MLYYPLKNYDEFKELFGIVNHGNGVKSRKNKILLSFWKTKAVFKRGFLKFLPRDMASLKNVIGKILINAKKEQRYDYHIKVFSDFNLYLASNVYEIDEYNGICQDGRTDSVRYIKHEDDGRTKVYRMKAGKFFRTLVNDMDTKGYINETVMNWICEEVTAAWQVKAASQMPSIYTLHIDDDFAKIYNSNYLKGDFYSCMVDKDRHKFYEERVSAKAAYLTDGEGMVVARAILFTNVFDESGNEYRYLERQYSSDGNDYLKRLLVDACIREGAIDCYKSVGAGCADSHAIVHVDGTPMSRRTLHIYCSYMPYNVLSYQDTFKYLNTEHGVAYNSDNGNYEFGLDTTSETLEGELEYDEYHERYCSSVVEVYYGGHWINCDDNDLDDFISINGYYYHKGDVITCDRCGEYVVESESYYSYLTECDYCCSYCRDEAEADYKAENWYFSSWDEEYFEYGYEVTTYYAYDGYSSYREETISVESRDNELANGNLFEYDNKVYDEVDEYGVPYNVEQEIEMAI